LATPLTFYISYQMLLTPVIRKHLYPYISENNFEPSNQIIVPTGYKKYGSRLKRAVTDGLYPLTYKNKEKCVKYFSIQ